MTRADWALFAGLALVAVLCLIAWLVFAPERHFEMDDVPAIVAAQTRQPDDLDAEIEAMTAAYYAAPVTEDEAASPNRSGQENA